MSSQWALVRLVTLGCVIFLAGCPTPAPEGPSEPSLGTSCATVEDCERALYAADDKTLPIVLARHADLAGHDEWLRAFEAMRAAPPDRSFVVYQGDAPALDAERFAIAAKARLEPPLLAKIARVAGRRHVLYLAGERAHELFPLDALEAHALGLPAVLTIETTPAALANAVELARELDAALGAAGRFEYRAAASAVDALRARLASTPASESALRASFAVWLLDRTGIGLEPQASDTPVTPAWSSSTPYGALLAARMAALPDSKAAWQRADPLLRASLDPRRAEQALAIWGESRDCAPAPPPPMDRPGDLVLGTRLSHALDREAASAEHTAAGKLALGDWLPLYEAEVALVDRTATAWCYLPQLLSERGELGGLSADGSAAYRRVSELALRHVQALGVLATAEPSRFRALAAVNLVVQPGLQGDLRLRDAAQQLVAQSTALKLGAATDERGVFDGSLAAFMAASSLPPAMQGVQLAALEQALDDKLGGPFGARRGWSMAGLHAARGILGLMAGKPDRIRAVAPAVAASLAEAELPNASLGRLAIAGARYLELAGTPALDANTANPQMFSPERQAARDALGRAIASLAEGGASSSAERELFGLVTDLGDGLVAALAQRAAAPAPTTPSCAKDRAAPEGTPLRDAFDRLQKKRRELTGAVGFDPARRGASPRLARARLLGLLLSDLLDFADSGETVDFHVPDERAERIVREGLRSFGEPDWAGGALGGYQLLRAAFSKAEADAPHLAESAVILLDAVSKLFGEAATGGETLLQALVKAGAAFDPEKTSEELAQLMVEHARRAYAEGAGDRGDLLLFAALGLAVAREKPVPEPAVELAREQHRPAYLPLLLSLHRSEPTRDPTPLAGAMRQARVGRCDAPSPETVIAVRQALYDFRAGRQEQALAALESFLREAEARGLTIPRLTLSYQQATADKLFKLDGSFSYGSFLLKNSSRLQLGLGVVSDGTPGGRLDVGFAPALTAEGIEEAARFYAHAATVTAILASVAGDRRRFVASARRGVEAWVHGVRLGTQAAHAGARVAEWASDATATLAIAAEIAAEDGDAFLAGDLWTLARAALGADADDAAVASVLAEAPPMLAGIAALDPVRARATVSLRLLAAGLACTEDQPDTQPFLRVGCDELPRALALRVAEGLPALPRLSAAATGCPAWQALDGFLGAAEQGRYDPDKLSTAALELRAAGHEDDAATLLARQRHPQHCARPLVELGRALGRTPALGSHQRADMLAVAIGCATGEPDAESDADLVLLEELSRSHADATRAFEATMFAARLALDHGRYGPLGTITGERGFIERWRRLGPELATRALLLHHAAAAGAGKPLDAAGTLPFYRLLCTTFPVQERGPLCNTITLLRGDEADKKRLASEALRSLLAEVTASPKQP